MLRASAVLFAWLTSLREESAARQEEAILQDGYRFALGLTNHHHDAQDLVQQAAVRLYRCYGGVGNRKQMFMTVRNLFYDELRRRRVVSFQPLESDEIAESDAGRAGARCDVMELLEALNPGEREVMFLHYVMGYNAREIAGLTKHPRNTVLSLLRRSREKLSTLDHAGVQRPSPREEAGS